MTKAMVGYTAMSREWMEVGREGGKEREGEGGEKKGGGREGGKEREGRGRGREEGEGEGGRREEEGREG